MSPFMPTPEPDADSRLTLAAALVASALLVGIAVVFAIAIGAW